MTVGPHAEVLAAASRENKVPLPSVLHDVPWPIDQYQKTMLTAFWTLSTCRSVIMGGVGPIPWVAIDQYIQRNGFDYDELSRGDFEHIIQKLDETFMEIKADQIKEEQKRGNKNPPGIPGSNARAGRGAARARR